MKIRWSLVFLFFLLGLILILTLPSNSDMWQGQIWVHFTFLWIGSFSVYAILQESNRLPYGCRTLHWVFFFFFFFLAPYLQYLQEAWPLNYIPTEGGILKANLMIILWMSIYHSTRSLFYYKGVLSYGEACMNQAKGHINEAGIAMDRRLEANRESVQNTLLALLMISLLMVGFLIRRIGLINLISSRDTSHEAYNTSSTALSSLLTYVVRNTITFTAFLCCFSYKKRQVSLYYPLTAIVLLLLGCSPFAVPRFQAATIYLTLLLLLFPRYRYRVIFVIFFIMVFVVGFPLLSGFRYESTSEVSFFSRITLVLSNLQSEYLSANYDAYTMLMKTNDYLTIFGSQHGLQLLATVLFFIPRGVWPGKPVSTGTLIQERMGAHVSAYNVSSSLISEAMIDFGIIGIVFYALVFSAICNWIDLRLSARKYSDTSDGILFLVMPPLLFFLIRGSLMSVWAFVFSYILIGKIITWFYKEKLT